jgi:hypothetical protein
MCERWANFLRAQNIQRCVIKGWRRQASMAAHIGGSVRLISIESERAV